MISPTVRYVVQTVLGVAALTTMIVASVQAWALDQYVRDALGVCVGAFLIKRLSDKGPES